MSMRRSLISAVFVWVVCVAAFPVVAQERPAEAVARVPALDSFHEVIYKIWHEAWPKKDAALLRQLAPEVEKGISQVASAPLPGILRDRKSAWDEGVKKLQGLGTEYKASAASSDDPRLMATAEKLHSQFESLMRVTRPALKELDEFHAVLYMLYHHYLPAKEMEKIRSSAAELKQKMAGLNAAQLPERLKQKDPEFQAAKKALSVAVDSLAATASSSVDKITAVVNEVHSNYQALERIFE